MKVTTSRHIQPAPVQVELGRVNGTCNDGMQPEVLAIRADIYLAVRVEYNIAIKKWDLVADISKYLARKYPDQPQWRVYWANALKEMGKVKRARTITKRGLKTHPDLTVFHFNLACYESLLGKSRSARKRLRRLCELHPRLQAWSEHDPDLARLRD
jgi:predicted Zn-dependent protease